MIIFIIYFYIDISISRLHCHSQVLPRNNMMSSFSDAIDEDELQQIQEEINYEDLQIDPEDNDFTFNSEDQNYEHVIIDSQKQFNDDQEMPYKKYKIDDTIKQNNGNSERTEIKFSYPSQKVINKEPQEQKDIDLITLDNKISINLKGLKNLVHLDDENKKLSFLLQTVRANGCEVVIAKEPIDQVKVQSEVKIQKMQVEGAGKLKIEQIQRNNDKQVFKGSLSSQQNCPKVILIISHDMRNNYNSYARTIYYTEFLNKNSQDLRITAPCSKCNISIGVIYGFTNEFVPITFGIYCTFGQINREVEFQQNNSYNHLMLMAFIRANSREGCKKFEEITFFAQSFLDIPKMQAMSNEYKRLMQTSGQWVPKYTFLMDPTFSRQTEVFKTQKIPQKEQIQKLLDKLLLIDSKKQFNVIESKLAHLLMNPKIGNCKMSNNCTVKEFIQIFMQESQYICASQSESLYGVPQYYFREHQGERQRLLKDFREQLIIHCTQIYDEVQKLYGEDKITGSVIFFMALGITDRTVQVQIQENKSQVNNNYKVLHQSNFKLIETEIPELGFLKFQTAKSIYDHIVKEITKCYKWQVRNEPILENVAFNTIEIEPQDELFYQQYEALTLVVEEINTDQENHFYYQVIKKQDKWICQCGFNQIYGMPCVHQLKICLLTTTLIRTQIESSYFVEQYYERCMQEKQKLDEKIQSLKRQLQMKLEPLYTQIGRQEIVNFKTKHRFVSLGTPF